VAVLDKILNPTWYAVSRLPEEKRMECALILLAYQGGRFCIERLVLKPLLSLLQGLGEAGQDKHSMEGATPISNAQHQVLSTEALSAVIKASERPGALFGRFRYLTLESVRELVGTLAVTELEAQCGGTAERSLDDSNYSSDPDEAGMQFVLSVMRAMGMRKADLALKISALGFADMWMDVVSGFWDGTANGLSRTGSNAAIFRVARDISSRLSPAGKALVKNIVTQLMRAEAPPAPSRKATADAAGPHFLAYAEENGLKHSGAGVFRGTNLDGVWVPVYDRRRDTIMMPKAGSPLLFMQAMAIRTWLLILTENERIRFSRWWRSEAPTPKALRAMIWEVVGATPEERELCEQFGVCMSLWAMPKHMSPAEIAAGFPQGADSIGPMYDCGRTLAAKLPDEILSVFERLMPGKQRQERAR